MGIFKWDCCVCGSDIKIDGKNWPEIDPPICQSCTNTPGAKNIRDLTSRLLISDIKARDIHELAVAWIRKEIRTEDFFDKIGGHPHLKDQFDNLAGLTKYDSLIGTVAFRAGKLASEDREDLKDWLIEALNEYYEYLGWDECKILKWGKRVREK